MERNKFEKIEQLTRWRVLTYPEMIDLVQRNNPGVDSKEIPPELCSICQFEFEPGEEDIAVLSECVGLHFFHTECIENCRQNKNFLKCPNCMITYGRYIGNMPKGTMTVSKNDHPSIPGYPGCGVITINYRFKSQNHQNIQVSGISRTAFLPDNEEGNYVLTLLLKAFHARITFRVGTSVTTGRDNCIVWNGIHHKTNIEGGSSNFGYPDPTYLFRVREELKACGIS